MAYNSSKSLPKTFGILIASSRVIGDESYVVSYRRFTFTIVKKDIEDSHVR